MWPLKLSSQSKILYFSLSNELKLEIVVTAQWCLPWRCSSVLPNHNLLVEVARFKARHLNERIVLKRTIRYCMAIEIVISKQNIVLFSFKWAKIRNSFHSQMMSVMKVSSPSQSQSSRCPRCNICWYIPAVFFALEVSSYHTIVEQRRTPYFCWTPKRSSTFQSDEDGKEAVAIISNSYNGFPIHHISMSGHLRHLTIHLPLHIFIYISQWTLQNRKMHIWINECLRQEKKASWGSTSETAMINDVLISTHLDCNGKTVALSFSLSMRTGKGKSLWRPPVSSTLY